MPGISTVTRLSKLVGQRKTKKPQQVDAPAGPTVSSRDARVGEPSATCKSACAACFCVYPVQIGGLFIRCSFPLPRAMDKC
jgi:hypothetical protein